MLHSSRTSRRFPGRHVWLWLGLALLAGALLSARAVPPAERAGWFDPDPGDEVLACELVTGPEAYDASVLVAGNGVWMTWLEFEPGQGDHLWVGLYAGGQWKSRQKISEKPGDYARPTLTRERAGGMVLTYEKAESGNWDVWCRVLTPEGKGGEAQRLSENPGADIEHVVAADPAGGLWVAWQGDVQGKFALVCAHWQAGKVERHTRVDPFNCWHPAIAATADGRLHLVWDAHDGTSYNVYALSVGRDGKGLDASGRVLPVATTPGFEGHAGLAADAAGRCWVTWEEDGVNWGGRYFTRLEGTSENMMNDSVGPLHRFRKLHLAQLEEKKARLTAVEVPQPAFTRARSRTNAPAAVKDFGAYYERGQVTFDGRGRLWVVYRHAYAPLFGVKHGSHVHEPMRLYARCLLPEGWSRLYALTPGQGDGLQRISVAPLADGIQVAWTVGRTDRRTLKTRRVNDAHRGVVLAAIHLGDAKAAAPAVRSETVRLSQREARTVSTPRPRAQAAVAGKTHELFFGDLHRHTDISLCAAPVDGTMDDAYRYAIDVAPLEFLGVTDHTHDLDWGNGLAQIWWRTRKEVARHELAGRFVAFYTYERSGNGNDHNVISLRDDMLRPHTYPHRDFWKELDSDTFTIPHQPFKSIIWQDSDDAHRALLEIYQGARNVAYEGFAQEGLQAGHKFGIIASSDHMSTSVSYAGVWAPQPTREAIFRAMQARRTFGATARVVLRVTSAGRWMGESFEAPQAAPVEVLYEGTDNIASLEFLVDGQVRQSRTNMGTARFEGAFEADKGLAGRHYFQVNVRQTDGNRAWSSPLWVEVKP